MGKERPRTVDTVILFIFTLLNFLVYVPDPWDGMLLSWFGKLRQRGRYKECVLARRATFVLNIFSVRSRIVFQRKLYYFSCKHLPLWVWNHMYRPWILGHCWRISQAPKDRLMTWRSDQLCPPYTHIRTAIWLNCSHLFQSLQYCHTCCLSIFSLFLNVLFFFFKQPIVPHTPFPMEASQDFHVTTTEKIVKSDFMVQLEYSRLSCNHHQQKLQTLRFK